MAAQYELLKELLNSGTKLSFEQDFFFKFYQAFLLKDRWMQYISGVGTTLLVTALALALGVVLGSVVALVRVTHDQQRPGHKNAVLGFFNAVCQVYTTIIRGTPMMAQAMFIYYGLMPLLGINSTITQAAYFILSINTGAYMAETVRGGILSIDPGQTEGAKSIGMTHVQTMIYVILPQALRNLMPQIGNNLIINIKDSCVLSVIGVAELLYKTKAAAGALYMNFETYTITMIMYFIMTFTCSRLLRLWEKKMDGADNFDLATTDTLAYTSGMYRYPDDKKEEQ